MESQNPIPLEELAIEAATSPEGDAGDRITAMLEAIDGARHSVGLASYIFRDDAAGGPVIDALIANVGI